MIRVCGPLRVGAWAPFVLAPALVLAAACGDAVGTGFGRTSLVLVPAFGELATFADNADRLRIVVTRVADTALVKDTTVGIDPASGEAAADVQVQLSSAAEVFEVLLQAIRGSDGAVLFEGVQSVTVTTAATTPVDIPLSYAGPTGAFLTLEPADTAVAPGTSFTYRAVVFDTLEAATPVPVTFGLAAPADSTILTVQRHTGAAAAAAGSAGTVAVVARTPDGLADTARVTVGQVAFSVSGTILVGTTPLAGVSVAATGGHTQTVTTAANGSYVLTNVALNAANIVITPALAGYSFTPASRTVAGPVTADVTGQNFAAAGGLRVTPGFATLGAGGSVTLTASLLDAAGVVVGPTAATWVSRSPGVATVSSPGGVVTGLAGGTAVLVGTAGSVTDSMLVRVGTTGSVPVSAIADGRAFRAPRVGDTVIVDVTASMAFTGGELLGSYNAQLTWNAAMLRYVDVLNGNFGTPTINDTQSGQGSLRFSAANAAGVAGSVTVARVRFVAQAVGGGAPALTITELSAAQTFTNLLSSVVVTNGSVTVRP